MLAHKFFKLFPPPKFLDIPHAGLDISDDAVRCIEYSRSPGGFTIHRFGNKILPAGVVEGGEIKDPKTLSDTIASLAKELKISVVKSSLPEEKMYLFSTEVPSRNKKEIRQNIEFKLEENVPLSPAESVFFFDLIPYASGVVVESKEGNPVSVSVAPRTLVDSYLQVIKAAGLTVLSFEVQAKAIARAVVDQNIKGTDLIVYIMNRKTGIYVICGGVVCFTSTISWGYDSGNKTVSDIAELRKQLLQVTNYWTEHGRGTEIGRIILTGKGALVDGLVSHCSPDPKIKVEIGNVWQNTFPHDSYIPPIPYEESLDYAIAAGLALPTDPT
jgi:Tfp pilus assembly PilM family ATPase